MPTYQYRCTSCDDLLEVQQKFTDPALTTCPECGGELRKVYNAVGVVFKGSGFYATDSRSKGRGDAAKPQESKPAKESSAPAAEKSTTSSTSSDSASSTGSK